MVSCEVSSSRDGLLCLGGVEASEGTHTRPSLRHFTNLDSISRGSSRSFLVSFEKELNVSVQTKEDGKRYGLSLLRLGA